MSNCQPQRLYLFHDLRHIQCGDLEWRAPDGTTLPLVDPPEQTGRARAEPVHLPRGIRLAAKEAKKTECLPAGVRLGRVVFEEGLYRSWYLDAEYPAGKDRGCHSNVPVVAASICSVESKDGLDWSAPAASPIHADGQTAMDGFTVFRDPAAPSSERYKAVYMAMPSRTDWAGLWKQYQRISSYYRDSRLGSDYMCCLYGAVSPDGVQWKAIREPLMIHKGDTDTTVYYDANLRKYVMYTRLFKQGRRWVGRAETSDFRQWEGVMPLLWPDLDRPLSDDIYTNCRTTYPGIPAYHLMFPMIYHRRDQRSDVWMYSSEDGISWGKVPGGPVVRHGKHGSWDAGFIALGNDLVPWRKECVATLYRGTAYPHKYPRWPKVMDANRIAWAYWPTGRLSAIVADGEGEFWTPPMTSAGRTLRLNICTRPSGWIRVGAVRVGRDSGDSTGREPCKDKRNLRGATGTMMESAAVCGDGLSLAVRWNGEGRIDIEPGLKVALRFRLRAAELFGFEWVD